MNKIKLSEKHSVFSTHRGRYSGADDNGDACAEPAKKPRN